MTSIDKALFDQLLQSQSKTMAFVWLSKAGWPISSCSESAVTRLGFDRAALDAGDIKFRDLIHPEDKDYVQGVVSRAISGKTENLPTFIEYRLLDKNKEWLWVESETAMQMLDVPNGQPVVGFIRDISDRKFAEKALEQNKDRLELILEGSQLGMWDWNPQTNEVNFDSRWAGQLGLTPADIRRDLNNWRKRVHPDDLDDCVKAVLAHVEGETDTYENIHRLKHADGHWVHILDRGRVFERDSEGRATLFVGVHTDVTHLKKVELEAVAALNARDRFFSSMSHELRTPLHAILGTAEILETELVQDDQREKIAMVRDSSEYLLNLLKDILDVAKMDEGQMQLVESRFSLAEMIDRVYQLFEARARQKSLEFKTEIGVPDTLGLSMDQTRLTQVLVNIVSNAVKYTEEGQVVISVSKDAGDVVVCVQDTGIGIEDVDGVFKPFRQESKLEIDDVHTSGLGLTIVQKLCAFLSLELKTRSQVGQGSEFELRIPAVNICEVTPSLPKQDWEPDLSAWRLLKVLVVDDNKVNRVIARTMLQKAGIEVTEAIDGLEAIELLRAQPFDVVCMDLHMPNLGGLRATQKIRALSEQPQPKIIGMSADAFPETIEQCLMAGMDDYVTKPFKQKDILFALERVLRQTKKEA